MKRIWPVFLLIFILISQKGYSQEQAYDPEIYLPWDYNQKLSWDLYTGDTIANSIGDAGTSVKIKATPFIKNGEINYHVHALFNMKKSWYKVTSDRLLEHEQLHFDIAELTARRVRKKIEELKDAHITDVSIYNKAIRSILYLSNSLDRAYDKETLHGILTNEQKRWEVKIRGELRALNSYQNTGSLAN